MSKRGDSRAGGWQGRPTGPARIERTSRSTFGGTRCPACGGFLGEDKGVIACIDCHTVVGAGAAARAR